MEPQNIKIIGGGLAGCEAALQLASAGVFVDLFEMRPGAKTPAHQGGELAELVCSNSFKGTAITTAHGLFKEELKRLGSHLMSLAFASRVQAGQSLAVDREAFSKSVGKAVKKNERITIHRQEIQDIDPNASLIEGNPR